MTNIQLALIKAELAARKHAAAVYASPEYWAMTGKLGPFDTQISRAESELKFLEQLEGVVVEMQHMRTVLDRIRNYSDKGNSDDDLLMIVAIADDALEPKHLVES